MHRIVGLDVGARALRVVALESGFRGFRVLRAAAAELAPDGPSAPPLPERLRAALSALGIELGDDAVAVALPGSLVTSQILTLPFLDPRRIEQVLPAEVEGAIPFEIDEVMWDHAVLSQAGGRSEVLVGVVRKEALREWLTSLQQAGIDPRVVTFGPLALAATAERGLLGGDGRAAARALAAGPAAGAPGAAAAGASESSAAAAGAREALAAAAAAAGSGAAGPAGEAREERVLLIDAEPGRADVALVRGAQGELCRALSPASAAAWDAAEASAEGLDRLLAPLLRDLKITLRARGKAARAPEPPDRVALAGRLARLPGAAARLSAALGLPAAPFALAGAAARLPAGSPPADEVAMAFGLSLRAQQPRGKVNFRKGELAFTRDFSQLRKQAARLSLAVAILLVLSLGLGIARLASLGGQIRDYDDALCSATRRILGQCVSDYRQAVSRLSGDRSKAAGIPRVGAAAVLAEVVAHLPEAAMPQLDEVEATTTSVRIRGTVEAFGAVDPLVSGLKADKCFGDVKQPRTEKLRDGSKVSFSIEFAYTCSGEVPGGA